MNDPSSFSETHGIQTCFVLPILLHIFASCSEAPANVDEAFTIARARVVFDELNISGSGAITYSEVQGVPAPGT